MKLYQLLWTLLKHGLHGRFRDEVCLAIDWNTPQRNGSVTGVLAGFSWESHPEDRFCTLSAESKDGPWSNSDEDLISELIEASSLGTPEAKALRASVPDEVVRRVLARSREIELAPEVWIDDPLPGGYVCGAPDPAGRDGICGMPVEDEPCRLHSARQPS